MVVIAAMAVMVAMVVMVAAAVEAALVLVLAAVVVLLMRRNKYTLRARQVSRRRAPTRLHDRQHGLLITAYLKQLRPKHILNQRHQRDR